MEIFYFDSAAGGAQLSNKVRRNRDCVGSFVFGFAPEVPVGTGFTAAMNRNRVPGLRKFDRVCVYVCQLFLFSAATDFALDIDCYGRFVVGADEDSAPFDIDNDLAAWFNREIFMN